MIDLHTHMHPPRLFAAIRRWFAERSPWVLDHPVEPEAIVATYRANGVERFVFCSYAHKAGMARELNAWLAERGREFAGYGFPLATVHLDDPAYLDDLRTALDDGCIGLKIHEDVQRLAVDDARFDPVYALLAERRAFVLAHVGPIPWDMGAAGGPARVARVLERHPDLRFVVAHLGAPDTATYFEMMPRFAHLGIDTTMCMPKTSPMFREVDAAAFERHAERIYFGTDYPNTPYPYRAERDALERLGLSAPALEAIVRGNAAKLIAEGTSAAKTQT